jgi:predicted nucleic acid-binding protein
MNPVYLLDTNVLTELWKPNPDPRCDAWMKENNLLCALSVITIGEIQFGVELLPFGKRRADLLRRLSFAVDDYADVILPFSVAEALAWGEYAAQLQTGAGAKVWTARRMRDSLLAATARAWGLIVATRDTSHFPHAESVNPFA